MKKIMTCFFDTYFRTSMTYNESSKLICEQNWKYNYLKYLATLFISFISAMYRNTICFCAILINHFPDVQIYCSTPLQYFIVIGKQYLVCKSSEENKLSLERRKTSKTFFIVQQLLYCRNADDHFSSCPKFFLGKLVKTFFSFNLPANSSIQTIYSGRKLVSPNFWRLLFLYPIASLNVYKKKTLFVEHHHGWLAQMFVTTRILPQTIFWIIF